jgi:hypothetical protein
MRRDGFLTTEWMNRSADGPAVCRVVGCVWTNLSAGVFSMLDLILIVCTIVIFYAFDRYTVALERL